MNIISVSHIDNRIENGYNFDSGKYFSKGFELFKKDLGNFLLVELLIILISGIPVIGWVMPVNALRICKKVDDGQKNNLIDDLFQFDKIGDIIVYFLIVFVGMFAILIPIYILGIAGVFGAAFLTEQSGDETGAIMPVVMIVVGILFFLLLIFLMIAFTSYLFFTMPLLAFSSLDSMTIFKKSYKLVKKQFWKITFFNFICISIMIIGVLACYVGMFFTFPIARCMMYEAYKDVLFPEDEMYSEINSIGLEVES